MKVIDARTGTDIEVGQTVEYGDGEKLTLIDVEPGLLSASAFVERTYRDHTKSRHEPTGEFTEMTGTWKDGRTETARVPILRVIKQGPLVTSRAQIRLLVRWTHPRYFLKRVAFIP